jgi:hypothetical protein
MCSAVSMDIVGRLRRATMQVSEGKAKNVIVGLVVAVFFLIVFIKINSTADENRPTNKYAAAGDTIVVKDFMRSCNSSEALERFMELAASGDERAIIEHLRLTRLRGECRVLQPGTKLVVERTKFLSNLAVTHIEGNPTLLYVPYSQLQKD